MTIAISFSLRYFFSLFPRARTSGPALSIAWLGVSITIVQRVAAGIVTPEQMPMLLAFQDELNARHRTRRRK